MISSLYLHWGYGVSRVDCREDKESPEKKRLTKQNGDTIITVRKAMTERVTMSEVDRERDRC